MVALAAALGLWLWLDRDRVTEGERKRRENSVFVAWRREELTEVTIAHEGETLTLVRDASAKSTWRMTSPRAERVDPAAVERLLGVLEFATVARKASEGGGLGLDTPRATGTLRMGGLVVVFALGGPSPRPDGSSYLRVDDHAPIVVGKELVESLLTPSDVYRDRTVVPYLATELARFEVRHPNGGFALERVDERSFRIAATSTLASRAAVERMWASLAEMRAEAFPKDVDVERLTARPALTITMRPKDEKLPPAELVVGEACPGHPADVLVLQKAPSRVAACAPKDVVTALLVNEDALVERRLFSLRMDEIEELRLERLVPDAGASGAPAILELARKGPGFHERSPVDRDLPADEADAASELITRVAASEAERVSRAATPFVAVARARVRAAEHEEIVELGAIDARGRALLRRVTDDARLEVDAAVARRLVPRETTLRPRRMIVAETRRATRVVLRCGVAQELVDKGEGLRLVAPPGYETDGAITQLVDAVLRGALDAWVADADDGTFGLAKDGCHVVIAFEDGNAPLTVWFGAEGEGGVYGRVESRSGIFVAPRALRELAGRIYVSRGSLRVGSALVENVRVLLAGKPLPPPREPGALRAAVAGLTAERVESLGKARLAAVPELVLEITSNDSGPPRRIACGPEVSVNKGSTRLCEVSDVAATFIVDASRLAPFLPPRDASAPAPF
jgi:hypothetical protein